MTTERFFILHASDASRYRLALEVPSDLNEVDAISYAYKQILGGPVLAAYAIPERPMYALTLFFGSQIIALKADGKNR